jgi:hypothetical protein
VRDIVDLGVFIIIQVLVTTQWTPQAVVGKWQQQLSGVSMKMGVPYYAPDPLLWTPSVAPEFPLADLNSEPIRVLFKYPFAHIQDEGCEAIISLDYSDEILVIVQLDATGVPMNLQYASKLIAFHDNKTHIDASIISPEFAADVMETHTEDDHRK